jgi:hypothetical protein
VLSAAIFAVMEARISSSEEMESGFEVLVNAIITNWFV